jgi:VanZ family protein
MPSRAAHGALAGGGEERPARRSALAVALAWLAPVAYAALIYALSARSDVPALPVAGADKVVHAAEYAAFTFLLARALAASGLRSGRAAALAFLLAVAYGVGDEWHQRFVPGRDADPLDVAADGAGAAAAAALAAVVLRGRSARASIRP